MPTLLSSGFHPWLCGPSLIRRTAGCGPACPVVWQGRRGDPFPYADSNAQSLCEYERGDIQSAISLDSKLVEAARRIGKYKMKEAWTVALEEYIQHRKQLRILETFGTVNFDPEYKAERWRKRT